MLHPSLHELLVGDNILRQSMSLEASFLVKQFIQEEVGEMIPYRIILRIEQCACPCVHLNTCLGASDVCCPALIRAFFTER